jgi:protein TonB
MLAVRSRLRPRALGPLALALSLHALLLGFAAAFGFAVPSRVEAAYEALVIGLTQRPEPPPLPEPATLDELELSPSDDIPVLAEAPEPLPFDLALFDLGALPAASIVQAAPFALDPPEELAPGAGALGLLAPRIAVKAGSGGAAPAPQVVLGSGGGAGGDPSRSGTSAGKGAPAAVVIAAAAPRPAVVREPLPRSAPAPAYPRLSVRAGEEGSVLCRLYVSERGQVTRVEVVESSGFERLDEAARATLLGWSFEPRELDGKGVASTLLHRVTFRLET